MMRDGGDAKSLTSIGKMKIKDVYVNEYTALYMKLRYKAIIKLKSGETEEFIFPLAYALVMPAFIDGHYVTKISDDEGKIYHFY